MTKKILFLLPLILFLFDCDLFQNKNESLILSSEKKIISFTFLETKSINGIINNDYILVRVPNTIDVNSLTAVYTFKGKRVEVETIPQISGQTVNDFSKPVIFTVIADDDTTQNYTIIVNYENSLPDIKYLFNNVEYHQNQNIEINFINPDNNYIDFFSIEPELPIGLKFNQFSGEISGIPEEYFSESKTFLITGYNDLEKVYTTFTIICIHPIPPKIELSQNIIVVYENEEINVQITNSGGPIDNISVKSDLPDGIVFDPENYTISGSTIFRTTHYVTGNRFDCTDVYRIEAENSGGKSIQILHLSILETKIEYTGDLLNIEQLFSKIRNLNGDTVITETLYNIGTPLYRKPTINWLYEAYNNYSYVVENTINRDVARQLTRHDWLAQFPYIFHQNKNSVIVNTIAGNSTAQYTIDRFASKSDGFEYILEIVRNDENNDFPPFFRFYYREFLPVEPVSVRQIITCHFYMSWQESENFTYSNKFGNFNYTETKPVIVTRGIQVYTYSEIDEITGGGPIINIAPSSISPSSLSLMNFIIHEADRDPVFYYQNYLLPYIE